MHDPLSMLLATPFFDLLFNGTLFVVYRSLETLIIVGAFCSVSRRLSGGMVVAEKASPAIPSIINLR